MGRHKGVIVFSCGEEAMVLDGETGKVKQKLYMILNQVEPLNRLLTYFLLIIYYIN